MNAPPGHLGDVIHRWPTVRARRWVTDFLRSAAADPNVVAVVAVGSAIRPDVASEDLDLVVLVGDRAALEARPPMEIDLRAYELDDVQGETIGGRDLITWALRLGVPLHDPCGVWEEVVQRWRGRVPLPDPEMAERRAEVAHRQLRSLESAGDERAASEVRVTYLTHLARAALSRSGVHPASRPELPGQLRTIGEEELARRLSGALAARGGRLRVT